MTAGTLSGHRQSTLRGDARGGRWAPLGLLLVVVIACAVGVLATAENKRTTDAAARANILGDLYQDARYRAAVATSDQDQHPSQPAAQNLALTALWSTLAKLAHDHPTQANRQLLSAVDAYAGAIGTASTSATEQGRVEAAGNELDALLDEAEERAQTDAVAHLQHARSLSRWLAIGTPTVLAVGLLLGVVLVRVIRSHRLGIEQLATTDALTLLPNRLALSQRAAQVLPQAAVKAAAGRGAPVLLLLDLDRFKEVNDTRGHHFGDDLLYAVATRLYRASKESDLVVRLGGDEFAVLIPAGGLDAGTAAAGRIKAAFIDPFLIDGVTVAIGVSIGIAVHDSSHDDLSALLRCADVAMYVAKESRADSIVYRPEHDVDALERVQLLEDLRQGLERDELVVHYQPKISLCTGRVVGFEALVRWQHPTRGLLQPFAFLPDIEDSTLMDTVTQTVLCKALRQLQSWSSDLHEVSVAVNIPTRSLLDPTFPEQVAGLLARSCVRADLLTLEITESSAMRDPAQCIATLTTLRAQGVKISIDDYGTGYASMSYLKDLPVTELKIDRTFVSSMATDDHSAILARSIVDLGRSLGLTIVGEGIETSEIARLLLETGCDVGQGYHYSRPLPADDALLWAKDRSTITIGPSRPAHR